MKAERMKTIIKNLVDYISESVGQDNGEELYNILENEIGMTENEIDYLVGQFPESEFDGTDIDDDE